MPAITYDCRPATAEETTLTIARLREHTEANTGVKVTHEPFAVTAYRGTELIGSIIGKIYSGWLHLDLVWVADAERKRGVGRQLLNASIAEATRRGLTGIEVWTQSWQAPEFYRRCGFSEYATLDDFLPGHTRHVLRYMLKAAPR